MNRTKIFIALVAAVFSLSSIHAKSGSRNVPVEFLQSLSIGSKDITISIPKSYEIIHYDIIGHHQTLGFIPDNSSLNNWTQYIGIHIGLNTSSSASQNINNLQKYLKKTYPGAKVLDSDINRSPGGVQQAKTSVLFTDEKGEVVMSASYFSDNSKTVGVEVSQRVSKSVKKAHSSAENAASNAISFS